jgi:post-segregation antitoxin (ccd killing protein)
MSRRVYDVRMARVNVYLPDDLADEVREADLNVSSITQAALRAALDDRASDAWLDAIDRLGATAVTHEAVLHAVDAARDELGARAAR